MIEYDKEKKDILWDDETLRDAREHVERNGDWYLRGCDALYLIDRLLEKDIPW
jgi:hypothetical protein